MAQELDQKVKEAIYRAVQQEPFARALNMELVSLEHGRSAVEMTYNPAAMNNIYARAHGGAIFALIDEAFETASQTHGTIAVALNVNVNYIASPQPGAQLRAEAREVSRSKKTATYDIKVTDKDGGVIATCHALAFCTGKPIPFV
jgi:acyl-CoA thioesterase